MKFIDTHIHCVQNIDDGSQSILDSLQMLEMEYNQGVRDIFCTVHSEMIENMDDEARAFDQMEILYSKYQETYGNRLNLRMITEIHITQNNFEDCFYRGYRIVPWFRPIMGDYYLFEFGYHESAENMIDISKKLIERGIKPVLAHVERYEHILDAIDMLREMGCVIQVNIGSFIRGGFLAYVDVANELLDKNKIDILGTDAHRINWRPPIITDGYNKIKDRIPKEQLEAICYNNAARLFDI